MKYQDILDCIRWRFDDHRYRLYGAYVFASDWESDVFSVNKGGFAYEVEIKVSRSDFLADFKKYRKHRIMSNYKTGWIVERGWGSHKQWDKDIGMMVEQHPIHAVEIKKLKVPNRFFYACPEGLLEKKDMPAYAGLIWCSKDRPGQSGLIVKPAPLIHGERHDYRSILCDKFYFQNVSLKSTIRSLEHDLDYYKSLCLQLKSGQSSE